MKPPSVYDDTIPRSHRITRIIAIVSNIGVSVWLQAQCGDKRAVCVAVVMLEQRSAASDRRALSRRSLPSDPAYRGDQFIRVASLGNHRRGAAIQRPGRERIDVVAGMNDDTGVAIRCS
jgi:hypothetical protein